MKKPLNITVADATKDRAAKLSKQYGDGSISNLFERLVSEEFDREASDVDSSTWSEPSTGTAMLATMPLAEARCTVNRNRTRSRPVDTSDRECSLCLTSRAV